MEFYATLCVTIASLKYRQIRKKAERKELSGLRRERETGSKNDRTRVSHASGCLLQPKPGMHAFAIPGKQQSQRTPNPGSLEQHSKHDRRVGETAQRRSH